MTELATDNPIHEADYSKRTKLYQVGGKVGSILRRPHTMAEMSENPQIVDHDKQFTQLLMELQEKYGIQTPNISLYTTRSTEGSGEAYIEGQWVEGKNLSDEASEVPAPIVRQAIEAIISYYREAAINGGAYLSDLRPSNIIYGRTANDTADQLYFVDIEPLWSDNEAHQPLNINDMDRILPELWLLIEEGMRNGQDWHDLLVAYTDLVTLQK